MISFLQTWWPWLAVSFVASVFNLLVAYRHLVKKCSRLPFFQPWKSWGVWWWVGVQLVLPAGLFWLLYSLSCKPQVGWGLVGLAITFGLVFTSLVNAYVDTGFFGINIKDVYDILTQPAYQQIANSEQLRATEFWIDFQTDLLKHSSNALTSLDFLEEYFQNDVSLTPEERQNYHDRIANARALTSFPEQVKAIKALMEVRRQNLPTVLKGIGCSSSYIKKYFPRSLVP